MTAATVVQAVLPMDADTRPISELFPKLLPLIVIKLPPIVGPFPGSTCVTTGASYVNWRLPIDGSPSNVPDIVCPTPTPAGATSVIDVSLMSVTVVAAVLPMMTAAGGTRFLPLIVMTFVPDVGPLPGALYKW